MEKIKLEILGISYSQTQSGAYALILAEEGGKRRLPIIIGGYEAQAIAIELEKMKPSRPLTHDLFKSFATEFNVQLLEVMIHRFNEGVFYARLICEGPDKIVEIDSRTSDAVALAVRFQCPIYSNESVLHSAGIILDESDGSIENIEEGTEETLMNNDLSTYTLAELEVMLNEAIEEEDYEKASRIRDEIANRNIF